MKTVFAIAAFLTTSSTVVAAEALHFISGNELHEMCSDDGKVSANYYVAGVLDTVASIRGLEGSVNQFCLPPSATLQQATDIACKLLEDRPDVRHFDAAGLVQGALFMAWPCD